MYFLNRFVFITLVMEIKKLHQLFLKSKGVATDTRKIGKDQLFFALKGDNFNGNNFAHQSLSKGAAFAIIDEKQSDDSENLILVSNVLETLQKLAQYHRKYLKLPILAITGSNGKTTTKELIHAVLRKKYNTVATVGNFNNHIGVPLTLLSMNEETEFGIVEMGANHAREIAGLCEIALPDFGYITNFGKAHIEGFGSLEGVVKAKSELYDHLKSRQKLIFFNSDDLVQNRQLKDYEKKFSFGSSEHSDVKIDYNTANLTAEVEVEGNVFKSALNGTYNSVNMAAAICIGSYFNIPLEKMEKAVLDYVPNNNRSQILKRGSTTFLMDAYNANPTSMRASLESFHNLPATEKVVILGDMFELGTTSAEEHQEIATLTGQLNFQKIILVGSNFSKVEIVSDKMSKFENFQDLTEFLKNYNLSSSHVLVKGSRGMALERILEELKDGQY